MLNRLFPSNLGARSKHAALAAVVVLAAVVAVAITIGPSAAQQPGRKRLEGSCTTK